MLLHTFPNLKGIVSEAMDFVASFWKPLPFKVLFVDEEPNGLVITSLWGLVEWRKTGAAEGMMME